MVVFRDRRRSRHAAPATQDTAAAPPDRELESYLAAISPEIDVAPSEQTGRFTAQVFQLRLPAMRIEQLRRFAEERGVTPGSLAVDWVIERLDSEDPATGPLAVLRQPEPEPAGRPLPFRGEPGRRRRRA